jgi:hypothetical protein
MQRTSRYHPRLTVVVDALRARQCFFPHEQLNRSDRRKFTLGGQARGERKLEPRPVSPIYRAVVGNACSGEPGGAGRR